MVPMLTVLLTGFLTTMALVVAIGPQSAFLLRQGLRRDRVLLAIACCLAGDLLLIALGTAGVGVILDHAPWLLEVLRWFGVVYLLWFAARSFRSAWEHRRGMRANFDGESSTPVTETLQVVMTSSDSPEPGRGGTALAQQVEVTKVSKISTVATTALTLSILNPHAWVDCLVLLGTMANSFGEMKWIFAAGAIVACVVWHALVGGGGSALASLLNKPRTWVVIDAAVGFIMLAVATLLALNGL